MNLGSEKFRDLGIEEFRNWVLDAGCKMDDSRFRIQDEGWLDD